MTRSFSWTEEAVAALEKLCGEALSFSEIAGRLSAQFGYVSRCAVIGKAHRLGVEKAGPNPPKHAFEKETPPLPPATPELSKEQQHRIKSEDWLHAQKQKPRAPMERFMPFRPGEERVFAPREGLEIVEPVVSIPETTRVTLVDLKESMCRWPIGDPASPDFRYCGGVRLLNPVGSFRNPYCAEHAKIAYAPSHDRRRDAPAKALQDAAAHRAKAHARKPAR
jgi:GcrA cell cycle regulator